MLGNTPWNYERNFFISLFFVSAMGQKRDKLDRHKCNNVP